MIRAFYTAATSAKSNQSYLDIISNNMSNLQTIGYKAMKGEFSDLLYSNLSQTQDGSLMVGCGSKLAKTDTIFTTGTLIQTDKETDFAITGDGFFGIQKDDEIYYTRDGSFTIGNIDGQNYLMLDNGYVLDSNEEPIMIENIDDIATPAVYVFSNNGDLERVGDNLFKISNEDAEYQISENPELKRGFIEGSGVFLAQEMVKMIQTQRAFQFNSKIIQVADEIEQTINSLRG